MNDDRKQKLRDLALRAPAGPYKLWTSNSFRRISSDRGGDGDILCGIVQRSDNQPDLHAAPGVLDYFVEADPTAMLELLDEGVEAQRHHDTLVVMLGECAGRHLRLANAYEAHKNVTGAAQLRAVANLLYSIVKSRMFMTVLPEAVTPEPEIDLKTAGLRTRICAVIEKELAGEYGEAHAIWQRIDDHSLYDMINGRISFDDIAARIAGTVANMLEAPPVGGASPPTTPPINK